jgi:UDP-N-acetyl-D-mannosaminuronate dehydrogenase
VIAQRISIVGIEYVGLSTAVCFTSKWLIVKRFDVDARKADKINSGQVLFHEPRVCALPDTSLNSGLKSNFSQL